MDWLGLLAVQWTLKESSLAPSFENTSFLVLSLPYGPTLTSLHDYQHSHSFDPMDLCQQTDVLILT